MSADLHKPPGITQTYLVECESIRGIAILLVVFFHLQPASVLTTGYSDASLLSSFFYAGDTGVILFFVLSGFLLSLPFFSGRDISLRTFFKKRCLRILPAYLVLITVGAVYRQDALGFFKALFFWDLRMSTLWPFGSVTWSLMPEVQFYLLLPLIFLAWRTRYAWVAGLVLVAVFVSAYIDITGRLDVIPFDWSLGLNLRDTLFARWPSFLCGVLLALFHVRAGIKTRAWCYNSRLMRSGASDMVLLVLLVGLGLVLKYVATIGIFAAYLTFFDRFVYEAVLWALVIAVLIYMPLLSRRLFVNRLLYFFGVIAYSFYLWHLAILHLTPKFLIKSSPFFAALPHYQQTIFALFLALLVAIASYQFIEKPFLRLKESKF